MVATIYVTAASEEEMLRIGWALVEERLAACINVFPVKSIYRWQGAVQQEEEVAAFVKTQEGHTAQVIARIKELHSSEIPCIEVLPVNQGYPPYLAWVKEETTRVE